MPRPPFHTEPISRDILMNINQYIRIPFAEKGRDEGGCDCWGLVCVIYRNELGIELPHYLEEYDNIDKDRKQISNKIFQEKTGDDWQEVAEEDAEPYDVVSLRILGLPMHVGVVTPVDNHMIHIEKGKNAAHVSYTRPEWEKRKLGFFRYVGNV